MPAKRLLFSSVLLGLSGIAVALPVTAAQADTTAGLTPSSLSVQGTYQGSAVVGETSDIHGSLTIGGSGAPVGTTIVVTRTESENGDVTQYTTNTTDTLGDFEATDTLPALGTYTYVFTYQGNATTAPASYSDYEVTVAPRQTSIDFAGPTTDIAGQPFNFNGQLQPAGALDSPPAGTVVSVTRTLTGSTSTDTFMAPTDVNGDFSVKDTPPVAGTYTYTAVYTSDNPDILSSTGSFTVIVSPGPPPVPSMTYSGTVRLTKMGLCLDDRDNSARNGAVVQAWQCNEMANQQWQVYSDGTIRHDGLCLDATGYGTANGTKVQLWACTGGANQKWDTKDFRIHYDNPAAANKVLDDTAHGGNGTRLQIWNNLGGTNQFWATS